MIAGSKIVIIDDDANFAAEIKKFLEADGYTITYINDSLKAIDVINDVEPDLILLDIIMPGVDGFALTKQLRYEKKTKDIPIIVFTVAESMKEIFELEGVYEYLQKPLDKQKLLETIRRKLV